MAAHVLKQNPLKLARKEMMSVSDPVMEDPKASDLDPVQQELRKMVKEALGFEKVEDLTGKVYTAAFEPQAQVVLQDHEVGYSTFGVSLQ